MQEGQEKVAEQISRDVSQLCSQLSALWSRFLDTAVLNPHVLSYLAQEHHTLRVRIAPRQSQTYWLCNCWHRHSRCHGSVAISTPHTPAQKWENNQKCFRRRWHLSCVSSSLRRVMFNFFFKRSYKNIKQTSATLHWTFLFWGDVSHCLASALRNSH